MNPQQPLFDQRYQKISQTNRPGWSDGEGCKDSVDGFRRMAETLAMPLGRLLELGCGRGNIALAFAEGGWKVTGVDFSPSAIDWARQLADQKGLIAEFLVGDLTTAWSFPSASFDVVIDAFCLHFFHGDQRSHFLKEARRVLAPNGKLLLASSVNQPDSAHWEMIGYDPDQRVTLRDGVKMNAHVDVADVFEELKMAGFEVEFSEVISGDSDILWAICRPKISW